jgi:hypothetical protein
LQEHIYHTGDPRVCKKSQKSRLFLRKKRLPAGSGRPAGVVKSGRRAARPRDVIQTHTRRGRLREILGIKRTFLRFSGRARASAGAAWACGLRRRELSGKTAHHSAARTEKRAKVFAARADGLASGRFKTQEIRRMVKA